MAVVNMKIVVRVRDSVGDFYPGPRGPGKTFIFSERLVLESINDDTNGVPPGEDARRAGTHAGIVTTLTENDTYQLQYEATFRLSALPFPPPHGLPAGQITARGIFLQGGAPPAEKRSSPSPAGQAPTRKLVGSSPRRTRSAPSTCGALLYDPAVTFDASVNLAGRRRAPNLPENPFATDARRPYV